MKASFVLIATLLGALAESVRADTFGSGINTFDIEFVTIGNSGNATDDVSANPDFAGSVPYIYRIGKFEVSRGMVTKANSAGGLEITLADMAPFGGNSVHRPATGVSWNEAARFVNWLNTSQGFLPAYKFTTLPGDDGYDANQNISLWVAGDAGFSSANPFRNTLAHYFLPSVDEWYKAAYFDPTSGVYHNYPTGSDSAPTSVVSGTAAGTAVYEGQPGPADITLAGGLSPYGTMGQGGNVYEWEETEFDLVNDSSSSIRGFRGGVWSNSSLVLSSSFRLSATISESSQIIGFRVAAIPDLPGDFNHDGFVNAADYVVWSKTGINGPTGHDTWRTHFGEPGGSGSGTSAIATIPEPATSLLLILAVAGLSTRRR
jgi:sulfatase modifying factor 1